MDEEILKISGYSVPFLITFFLSILFYFFKFSDRAKNGVAIFLGIGISYLSMIYHGEVFEIATMIDRGLYGLMQGAASVGLWKTFNIQIRRNRK